jgi:hypothetical protein
MSTIIQVIPVPQSGLGASVDVSSMVGPKTVFLTGRFKGAYVLYGSQDGTHFAPLFQFDAGGVEGIRQTFKGALARLAIKSLAADAVGVTASVSGESVPGDNTFVVLGTLGPGASGAQPSYDLGASNFQSDVSFLLAGGLEGKLVVEGSSDNVGWNPVGQFSVDPSGPGLLGPSSPEFAPLETDDLVRYVRLNVLGRVVGGLTVTVGGSKGGGGGGASQTLAQTYQAGASAGDQEMVMSDDRGGGVVLDATGLGFADVYALEVLVSDPLVPGGKNAGCGMLRGGGLDLGPHDIVVGFAVDGRPALNNTDGQRIVVGNAVLNTDPLNPAQGQVVVIGCDVTVNTRCAHDVIIGSLLTSGVAGGQGGAGVLIGYNSSSHGAQEVLVGQGNVVGEGQGSMTLLGSSNSVNTLSLPESDGKGCLAVGKSNVLDGDESQAVGYGLKVVGDYSFAGGSNSAVYGSQCVVIGSSVSVGEAGSPVDYAIACGSEASVVGIGGVAIGRSASAGVGGESGASNVAVGDGAIANNDLRGGYGTVSVGVNANGYGDGNVLVGPESSVFGTENVVLGQSHVVGTASVDFDFNTVCGCRSAVWGSDSVVIGRENTVGVDVDHTVDREVVVGSNITVAASAGLGIAVGSDIVVGGGSETIVIGSSAGSGPSSLSAIAIGAHAFVSNAHSMAFGTQSQTLSDNQTVFGSSAFDGAYAVHDFVVRGYNGSAFVTLEAIDNPVDSGNPDRGVTGLTVVYIQNSVVSNKTLKAAPFASLPAGALVAYFDAPPA